MTILGCTQVCCTTEANKKFWKKSVAPSDYHLPCLARTQSGQHYANDKALKNTMHMWLQRKDGSFYQEEIHVLVLQMEESH